MNIAIKILDWTAQVMLLFALILSWTTRKNQNLLAIKVYTILLFLISFSDTFNYSPNLNKLIESVSVNVFSIIEISLIYYFLHKNISYKKSRHILKIFWLIYISICAVFWTANKDAFFSFAPALFGMESILIVIPCLIYIFEILNSELKTDLKRDPNFIVTCGVLFYFSISVPIYFSWFTLYYLSPGFEKILLITNTMCTILLIISFMKAYLCQIPDQQ